MTGATGAVGPAVVRALGTAGFRVRLLELTAPEKGLLEDGAEVVLGDVTDAESVRAAVRGVSAVVHLAALLHQDAQSPDLREDYQRINVGGTAKMVEASLQARVERFVLFSTISVYGATPGSVASEETPPWPDTVYAETKLAAERIVLGAQGLCGGPFGTVLRLAAVYGPRMKGNYLRLLRALARRRFVPIGNGRNRRTVVFDRDAARAAVLALRGPLAGGGLFNVSDGHIHTVAEIISAICSALGRRPPRVHLPVVLARCLAGIAERVARAKQVPPLLTRVAVEKYIEDVAVDATKIKRELGYIPAFGLDIGWQTTIREMRQVGAL